jgi:hypothetical protein
MKYFKIKKGFGKNSFQRIDETELDKAILAQISGKVFLGKEGTIAGNNIIAIEPDYHRAMGFNDGYELQPDDWIYIRRDCKEYDGFIGKSVERIKSLMTNKPFIEKPISDDVKKLANKFKI